MKKQRPSAMILLLVLSIGLGCQQSKKPDLIIGAGATFPYPLYSKMFLAYKQIHNIEVNFLPIGSSAGLRQLLDKTVHFGASDLLFSEKELHNPDSPILHVPIALGAVVVVYNLPDTKQQLNLSGDLIARIFLGEIGFWDHADIKKVNPDANLPHKKIAIIRRAEGSGTTFAFSTFLSITSTAWKNSIGAGKNLTWPQGIGAKGNPGVTILVKQIPYSIGYTELTYAKQNNIAFAKIQNRQDKWITPSVQSLLAAAESVLPNGIWDSLIYTDLPNSYPITTFTWILLYKDLSVSVKNINTAKALAEMLYWMIYDGQKFNEVLTYGRLSPSAAIKADALLKSLHYKGKKLL